MVVPARFGELDECDCPVCSGEVVDPAQMIDEMIAGAGELVEVEEVLEAELIGAALFSIVTAVRSALQTGLVEAAGAGAVDDLVGAVVARCEEQASPGALALLTALGAVADGQVGEFTAAAAAGLTAAGVPGPGWGAALAAPVTVRQCLRLVDDASTSSILIGGFARAGREHLLVVTVNHLACGQADDIGLLDAAELPGLLRRARATPGVKIIEQALEPADFRWYAESALRVRADHDSRDPAGAFLTGVVTEEEGPGYQVLAGLLRSRLRALPVSTRPTVPHGNCADLDALGALARFAADRGAGGRGRAAGGRLPAKRRKADGPAPVYQIKVGLRGAKPPIWRRLEVPASISLAKLHDVIQAAFDWEDSHLHVFATPYGEFGLPDQELGHRSERPVSLEQVAPGEKRKITYTYDFGDDWEHEILVEKVLDRQRGVRYPRCTGGRRAAPPEDCGGVWGYANLLEVLADPDDPEYGAMVEWLCLDDPAEFDPAAFDQAEVNAALSMMA